MTTQQAENVSGGWLTLGIERHLTLPPMPLAIGVRAGYGPVLGYVTAEQLRSILRSWDEMMAALSPSARAYIEERHAKMAADAASSSS